MLGEWLFTLAEKHRPGMGEKPWIKYIDKSYDNRMQNTYFVRVRGYGWEIVAHSSNGSLREQILKKFAELGSQSDGGAELPLKTGGGT